MDGSLHLAPRKSCAALRFRIVGAVNFCHIAVLIRLIAFALYKVRIHKTNFITRKQPEILFRRLDHKVLPLNVKLPAERKFPLSKLRVLKIVVRFQIFHFPFWVIVYYQLHRVKHCHHTGLFQL